MKDFFKMMFASTLGFIIASVILSILSFIIFMGVAASLSSTPTYNLKKNTIMNLDLNGVINERESSNPWDMLLGSDNKSLGLNDILNGIKKAKENENIKGIYIKAGMLHTGFATLEPIRKALIDFKESGKFIVTYGETMSQGAYYVASVSDKIFMNPQGMFMFMGLGSSKQYNKGVFEKWGVQMQVFRVGTYKSYVEPYIQDKMSDANREQVTSYLNDIWGTLLPAIAESRKVSVEDLNRYADEFLMLSKPENVVSYGLIDELKYGPEVESYLKEQVALEKDKDLQLASVGNMKTVPFSTKKVSKNKIAILYAEGSIVDDAVSSLYSGNVITAKEYVKELKKLQEDESVKAVVFRVNSGGGSAYASEQIWHAVKELKAVKPIIVSMGDYAASGGYYISCAANKIIAEPTTITGSIGIFGLYPSGEELAKKMGASYDGVATNKHALFGGDVLSIPYIGIGLLPARPLNTEEQALMQGYVERGYDLFISRCSEGRSKTKEEIDSIGQGRVWTGNQAIKLGLVDQLGGMADAVKLAAEAAGIEDYSLSDYPAKKDFFTQLMEESLGGAKTSIMKEFMGKEAYEQKCFLKAIESCDFRQAIIFSEVY